jgi:NitT/TauT family transport system ATP-binding protein
MIQNIELPNAQDTLTSLQKISLQFPGSASAVLEQFSMNVYRHEFLSLVGPSGCGKSSLLRIVAGLQDVTSGTVKRMTPDLTPGHKSSEIGFVFQHPTLLPWRTAAQNLTLPLELNGMLQNSEGESLQQKVSKMLNRVGLSDADADKRPAELSGGMQMRLSLARALIVEPRLLLLDEPLAAVDDLLRTRLQEDVSRLHAEQKLTTILVTHNLHEAAFLSDRVLILGGSPAGVLSEVKIPHPQPRSAAYRESAEFFEVANQLSRELAGHLR